MGEYMRILMAHRKMLTKQQLKTLKGQVISGNGEAAMRGLKKLMKKK